ncbi:MAG: lytic murein transglycosylase [Magnetococcales bacterium]|nr:lytic murein transglycosylase [Magnetococcales bacterium]
MAGLGAGLILVSVPGSVCAQGDIVDKHPWLMDLVTKDRFDRAWLNTLLSPLQPYTRVIQAMNRQAEAKPYHHYRTLFLTRKAVAKGRRLLRQHADLLLEIEQRYGVPGNVVVALWGIESRFGSYMGKHPVLRTLFTLATDYPRRATFFREQFRAFLLLCREQGWDPSTMKGSYAGAMGQVQMIPDTMRRYAVDHNGDGSRDVFGSTPDVLASIANYLHGHGWVRGGRFATSVDGSSVNRDMVSSSLRKMKTWKSWARKGVGVSQGEPLPAPEQKAALIMLEGKRGPVYHMVFNNFYVITRWNNSRRFAMVVREFSDSLIDTTTP